MKNTPLSEFNFKLFNYEVVFEYKDTSLFRRLLGGKKEHLVYYIRQVPKRSVTGIPTANVGEVVLAFGSGEFCFRHNEDLLSFENKVTWDNSTDPEQLITRAYLKLKPSQDNVTFSTTYLEKGI